MTGFTGVDVLVDRQNIDDREVQLALSNATTTPPNRIGIIREISDYPDPSQVDIVCMISSVGGRFATLLDISGSNLGTDKLEFVNRLAAVLKAICLTGTDDLNPYAMWCLEAGQPPRKVYLVVEGADEGRYDIDERIQF